MIRILIADDHKLLIDGLRPLLENRGNMEVVGVAMDGLEACAKSAELKPDIVLLDISMPKLNGIDAARKILEDSPGTKIIMLSMHADRKFIQESLQVGASGYILKESAANEVIEAIQTVGKGDMFFSKSVRDQVLRDYVKWVRNGTDVSSSPLKRTGTRGFTAFGGGKIHQRDRGAIICQR